MADNPYGATPGQSTTSWIGQSDNVIDLVGRIIGIKQHKQQEALGKVEQSMTLAQQGFPIDEKAFAKYVKASKLPIATDEDSLKAFYGQSVAEKKDGTPSQQANAAAGGNQPKPGQPTPGGGPGAGGPPPGSPPEIVAMHNDMQKVAAGQKLSPQEMFAHSINGMALRARNLMNTNAATEQQKADNARTIENLKGAALAGDPTARGRLMDNAQIPIDFNYEKWRSLSSDQRHDMLDVFAGHESQADKSARTTRIAESLQTSGRLTDPQSAFQAAQILASGGQLPASLQSKMKPFTFTELLDQTRTAGGLIAAGVNPNQVGRVMAAASVGGLENALPTGMKPLAYESLKLEQGRLAVDVERVKLEEVIAAKAAYAEAYKVKSEAQRAKVDNFKNLVEIKKAGGTVDPEVMKGAQASAADALGMDVSETKTLWETLTGQEGSKLEFKPRVTSEGESTVDKLSGKKKVIPGKAQTPSSGVMDTVIKSVKKFTGQPDSNSDRSGQGNL